MRTFDRTYKITIITNGLGDSKKSSEEGSKDYVKTAKSTRGGNPFDRCHSNEFLLSGIFASGDQCRELGELHFGCENVAAVGTRVWSSVGRSVVRLVGTTVTRSCVETRLD